MPVLLQLTGIYAASRLITFVYLYAAAGLAQPGSRFGPGWSLDRFIIGWDAQWYWTVAFSGYPDALTVGDGGRVAENAWAFMPVYAWLAQMVGTPFGYWGSGAAIVSLVSGLIACVALYRLLRHRISHGAALWSVLFFANGPLAALFHIGYAEALFMAMLLVALERLVARRFGWLYVLIPVMGYTRPGILAFSLMLALYGIWRWFQRGRDPLPRAQIVHIVVLGLLAAVVGLSWQVIAAIVTGMPGAYLGTELAWRRNWIPDATMDFFPFHGWALGLNFWFEQWGLSPIFGWALFVIALAGVVWMLAFSPQVKNLGMETRLWSASYLLYLLAVFFPQSSTLRLLFPLTPLWGAAGQLRSRLAKVAILAGCLLYQWFWIYSVFALGTTITQIP